MKVVINLNNVSKNLEKFSARNVNIIAVSKTFPLNIIKPLIDFGHIHFGENRIKEALDKWSDIISLNPKIQLHLIGSLQSNKIRDALKIFSYIHSLDSVKLAEKLSVEQEKMQKNIKYFIQVNFENEKQKGGVLENEIKDFLNFCKIEKKLNVIGLMCIPPIDKPSEIYFKKLQFLAKTNNLPELSMGMTSDYLKAIKFGSSFIRIGSLIFGDRK
jgi:pyridoxal phosphate enzyme (YggS family)